MCRVCLDDEDHAADWDKLDDDAGSCWARYTWSSDDGDGEHDDGDH